MVLFLDSTLFSYVKGRVGSPASGGTLFQDEAVLWCEERSDTMAYSMTTEYNIYIYKNCIERTSEKDSQVSRT